MLFHLGLRKIENWLILDAKIDRLFCLVLVKPLLSWASNHSRTFLKVKDGPFFLNLWEDSWNGSEYSIKNNIKALYIYY